VPGHRWAAIDSRRRRRWPGDLRRLRRRRVQRLSRAIHRAWLGEGTARPGLDGQGAQLRRIDHRRWRARRCRSREREHFRHLRP